MIYFFLISCFSTGDREICTQTPVPSLEVCHALIRATNGLGQQARPDRLSYYPDFRCVSIRSK